MTIEDSFSRAYKPMVKAAEPSGRFHKAKRLKEFSLDGWMFRMRDNYPQFDIKRWAAIHNDNDIKQHYPAINALETRADKFSYGYTMEINFFIAII